MDKDLKKREIPTDLKNNFIQLQYLHIEIQLLDYMKI